MLLGNAFASGQGLERRMHDLAANPHKENLVLVNAYLTNSLLLKGLIEFLGGYFNVYFIDLPGFIQDVPPLSTISVENYADHVQKRLESLDLESYVLAGISFGFLVASHLPQDPKCKGFIAIAPYINSRWLKLGPLKTSVYWLLVRLTLRLSLSAKIWESRRFRRAFHWYSDYPAERIDNLLSHMDGRTFFETARIILRHRELVPFHPLPYVLIINPSDKTIRNDPLLRFFQEKAKKLKVVEVGIDHYPLAITPDYFRDRIPDQAIKEIVLFVNGKGPWN
jgi:pimeloyl-ACP methyl ester carboxylesterase